jgi:2-oxoglutarate ferredoxin oxidoreductase subunit alpha
MGLNVFATRSYMSRIRGGLNWYDVRIGDQQLYGSVSKADILVAMTDVSLELLRETTKDSGLILCNGPKTDGAISIDLDAVAKQTGGTELYSNTVAVGAVFALLGYDVKQLDALLKKEFGGKGDKVVSGNQACARKGADLVAARSAKLSSPKPGGQTLNIYDGATAIGLSAAVSGVKFVTAYPMTPGTATFTYFAGAADEYGIVVEQAEDEIAAVNMVCGAAYAGVPAMTMTSGGGFALMVEGLSLAGMMELPIVILIAQRPGPATGLPTRTGQQDLLFALRAGHGEFTRAIFAPGSVQQCYDLTRRALQTAHKYQTPVLILSDQYLQDTEQSMSKLDAISSPIDRHVVTDAGKDYVRYALAESGISPRAVPGGPALVVCDSDEHTENGHITEDLEAHMAQQNKRMQKLVAMTAEAMSPEFYGPKDAQILLLTWGSTYGPAREAVDLLDQKGQSVAMLHFAQLWPLNAEAVRSAIGSRRRVISVEGNQTGQLATLMRSAGLLGECELLTNYTGLPFTGSELAERIMS